MHIRTKGRLAGLAFLAATSLMAEAAPTPITGPASPFDQSLAAASEAAIENLPFFIARAFDAKGHSLPGAEIKVTFQILDGHSQKAWLKDFTLRNGQITAIDPTTNAPVHLAPSSLSDWSLTAPDGRLYGAFTTRAALAVMHPEASDAMRAHLSHTPLPAAADRRPAIFVQR